MKEIILNVVRTKSVNFKKYMALVDDDDYGELAKHNWSVRKTKHTCYARAFVKGKFIPMHRMIMNAKQGEFIDHRDGNGLNNQKSNLRIATMTENNRNKHVGLGTSKHKGVSYHKKYGTWKATIQRDFLGYYKDEIAAAQRYNDEAVKRFGEFAQLNAL